MTEKYALSTLEDFSKAAGILGQSFGLTTPQATALMLIGQAEGIHPVKALQLYDFIEGKPRIKAEALLAKFQARQGVVAWRKFDNDEASATFSHPTLQPEPLLIQATWAEFSQTKIPFTWKNDTRELKANWANARGAMLRARLIARAVRMIDPGCIGGFTVPEEAEEDDSKAVASRHASVQAMVAKADEIVVSNAANAQGQGFAPVSSVQPSSQLSTTTLPANAGPVPAGHIPLVDGQPVTIDHLLNACNRLIAAIGQESAVPIIQALNVTHKCVPMKEGQKPTVGTCPADNRRAYLADIEEEITRAEKSAPTNAAPQQKCLFA